MKNITFNNYATITTNYREYQQMIVNALKHYMIDYSISISQISKRTTLSHSTIRSILNGKSFSWRSLTKLFALGDDFLFYFKFE